MWKIDEQKAQFYKIASFGQDTFTYYGFDTGGDFNIVGFAFVADERIALRLMRIDGMFLDDESFSAEEHGGPYFYCDVLSCKQFLYFMERVILRQEVEDRRIPLRCFEMLDASALRRLHYPETWNGVGRWYRYTEKTLSEEGEEKLSLICLPQWNKKYGIHQGSSFKVMTLTASLLEKNPHVLIKGNAGLGTIILTKEALEEVVHLIRETLRVVE